MLQSFKIRPRLCYHSTGTVLIIVIIFLLYHSETEDALPSAEDPSFSPRAKSIFFHETSSRSGLTGRQACAVEAAARAHPHREVYVLFNAPITENKLKTGCLAELLGFPNVKFLRLHIGEYSKGTAVQSLLHNDVKRSKYRIHHTADILRILTLNKWGGMYLDTDMIVTRSLDDLPTNFVAKQNQGEIASGILAFAKDGRGIRVTDAIIKVKIDPSVNREIVNNNYNASYWSYIGAEAIEAVLQRLCPKVMQSPDYQTKPIINCKGIMIFDFELFYPQDYMDLQDIFSPPKEDFDLYRPYTYHMWNFLDHDIPITRGTIYELVAKAFCPSIHGKFYYELATNTST